MAARTAGSRWQVTTAAESGSAGFREQFATAVESGSRHFTIVAFFT